MINNHQSQTPLKPTPTPREKNPCSHFWKIVFVKVDKKECSALGKQICQRCGKTKKYVTPEENKDTLGDIFSGLLESRGHKVVDVTHTKQREAEWKTTGVLINRKTGKKHLVKERGTKVKVVSPPQIQRKTEKKRKSVELKRYQIEVTLQEKEENGE